MKRSQRLNNAVHPLFTKYVVKKYRKKIAKVRKEHPELFRPVDSDLTAEHLDLWGQLGIRPSDDWLRFHVNLTGIQDPTFCPEDIFFSKIERLLVPCDCAGFGLEDKNELDYHVDQKYRVGTVLRWMRGAFFDQNYKWVSQKYATTLLREEQGDLIVKKCIGASGGHNVLAFKFTGDRYKCEDKLLSCDFIKNYSSSVVIERRLVTDEFSASLNRPSVNTCRMMTLRCPWNGQVVLLKTMLRFGVRDILMDNMMTGGLCINIDSKGRLGRYAYDYNGRRYSHHPVNGMEFQDTLHPHFNDLQEMVLDIAESLPYFNLLSFDAVADHEGRPKIIEINATSQGITQLQFDHSGLFGAYSSELLDWCVKHQYLDSFSHFRTFYS